MMDCEKMNHLLDAYLDGTLEAEQLQKVQQHLAECEACRNLVQMCRDLRTEEGPVPESWSSSWRQAIREEEQMETKQQKKHSLRSIALIAAAFVFIVGGTLITRDRPSVLKNSEANNYVYSAGSASANGMVLKRSYSGSETQVAETYDAAVPEAVSMEAGQEQKLIRRVDFTIKTMEFEKVVENLQALTASVNGRVEYLSQYGDKDSGAMRNATLTLRIPSDQLDAFLTDAENVGNITSYTNQVEDVTESYYDIETRLNTQLAKMERLQALMAEATEVSDLIEIESSIADTQYMIDYYQGQLNGMDDKVDFSTVTVYVQETRVAETKEASFFERIGSGISDSVEDGLEFLGDAVVFILSMLPWIAVVVIIVVVVKAVRKKKK